MVVERDMYDKIIVARVWQKLPIPLAFYRTE